MSEQSEQIQTPDWIAAILADFEAAGFFHETTVASRIAAARAIETLSEKEIKAARAECWAFQFRPHRPGQQSRWKTHFGPCIDDKDLLVPDVARIDSPIIDYWAVRMLKTKHPLLRARYADLVWDLSKAAVGRKPSIEAARIAADSYASSAALAEAYNAPLAFERAERGLVLALSIGDQSRLAVARDALFELSKRINTPIGWAVIFDIWERHEKVAIPIEQEKALLVGLEGYVERVNKDPAGCEPLPALHLAARLVRSYERLDRRPDADRVVLAICQSIERRAASAKHAVAHAWLDEVFRFYRVNGLDGEAERVQIEARKRGEQAQDEMEHITGSGK
jgi:lysyl-tRNA synthetase class 1